MCPDFNASVFLSELGGGVHILPLNVCPQHLVISLFRKLWSILREHQASGKTSHVTLKGLVSSQVKYEGPVLLWFETRTRLDSSGLSTCSLELHVLTVRYQEEEVG